MTKRLTYDSVKNSIEGYGYTLLSDSYVNAHVKLHLMCPLGHTYDAKFNNFQQGQRCPICNDGWNDNVKSMRHTHDHVKCVVESCGHKLLSDTYTNRHTNLSIMCNNKHIYEITLANFQKGQRCSTCSGVKRHTHEYIRDYIKKFGYKLLSDYVNGRKKILVSCDSGHTYNVTFGNFYAGRRCPMCAAESATSKGENDVALFVESLGINVIRNDRTKLVNPLTGKNLELDIWIESMNKAIEYNGTYWHSLKNNDTIKKLQCGKIGIELLVVDEDKWLNNNDIEKTIISRWLFPLGETKCI